MGWAAKLRSHLWIAIVTVCYVIMNNGRILQLLWYHGKDDILRQQSGAEPCKISQTPCSFGKKNPMHDVICNYILKGEFDLEVGDGLFTYIWSGLRRYFSHSGYICLQWLFFHKHYRNI